MMQPSAKADAPQSLDCGATGERVEPPPAEILVGGVWRPAAGGEIPAIDPSDGRRIGTIPRAVASDVDAAVSAARSALDGEWGRLPAAERGRLLARLSRAVSDQAEIFARLEALDTGKPLRQARVDTAMLARYLEFYGGAADKVHGETIPFLDGFTALTLREPHGVTGHIIPWNYPAQIVGRSIGAALAMGNACVVKPAEDAALSTILLGRLAMEAGFPPGALNIVPGYGQEAGAALAGHPGVDHVSFTGSREAGAAVQRAAAGNCRPVTLELGGKSPQILFADADLDRALPAVVGGVIQHAGQTCSAGSRLLVERPILGRILDELASRFGNLEVGSSMMDLDLGPVVNARQRDRIARYLAMAQRDGLPILAQGKISSGTPEGGFYVLPTLIGETPPSHPIAQEEIFGPVLCVLPFDGEAEALRLANGTSYGLVAGIWTRDGGRQFRLARALRAGQVFVNSYGAGGGVELPFGGVKGSGHGREKGFEALLHFSAVKTLAIQHG
jgi:aldehyde dehydrogenase (NAD+)